MVERRPLALAAQPLWLGGALVLLLLGFGLRLYRLDGQSLWYDEIISATTSRLDLPALFPATVNHPPLHYVLLHLWQPLGGSTDYALRFPSLLFGTLALPLLYRLGVQLGGRPLGALGALVALPAPFLVYYSQEARMYAPALVFTLLSVLWFLKAVAWPTWGRWLVWALLSSLAWYFDYSASLVLGLLMVLLTLMLLVSRRLALWRGVAAGGGVFLVALPWLLYRQPVVGIYAGPARGTDLWDFLRQVMVGFPLGLHADLGDAWPMVALFWFLALLGLAGLRSPDRGPLFLWLYLLLPLAALYLLSVGRRDFALRYALVVYPAFLLILGLGALALARRWRGVLWAVLPLVLLAQGMPLLDYYANPEHARDDFRGVSRFLLQHYRPGDVLAFNAPWGAKGFAYYGDASPPQAGLPAELPLQEEQVVSQLTDLRARYQRLWLVTWQDYFADPQERVKNWLDRNATPVAARAFPGIGVYGYLLHSPLLMVSPSPQRPLAADFGDTLRLLGYDLETRSLAEQSRLDLTLYWQALRPMDLSYRVFLHLIDPGYRLWGLKDNRPVYDRYPTDRWEAGTIVRDEYQILVDPGAPPGYYRVAAGVYDPATAKRLPPSGSDRDHLLLGPVRLGVAPSLKSISQPLRAAFGHQVELLGSHLASQPKPGATLELILFWRAISPIPKDYTVFVHLVDGTGRLVAQKDKPPADGFYPSSEWAVGEILSDTYGIVVPSDVPKGRYRLLVGLYDPRSGERLPLDSAAGDALALHELIVP